MRENPIIVCVVCGIEFTPKSKHPPSPPKCCSLSCAAKVKPRPDNTPTNNCKHCGKSFRGRPIKGQPRRYCSMKCSYDGRRVGSLSPDGYILIRDGSGKQVRQHRLVAEQMLGRKLRADEDVHHKNGDRADNRPENLEVLTHSGHSSLTAITRIRRGDKNFAKGSRRR